MKKIAIDCRYLGKSGIGKFLEGILDNFKFSLFDVYLIGKKDKIEKYRNCHYVYDDSNPFSIEGICKFKHKKLVNSCDTFFTPNFIIPFGLKTNFVTTLHDIIFLDMPEVNGSKMEFLFKKYMLKRCMKLSSVVFTVSKFSKARISYHFPKYKNKIIFSYQGISNKIKEYKIDNVKENYIIYVGNIKKHKGLKTLLEAYKLLDNNIRLKIVGESKNFKNGDEEVINLINSSNIEFLGSIDDKTLYKEVSHAKYLVQPSLYEGFGLPPLEALYLDTQPIISDIEVFKEVYSDLPVKFFNVGDINSLKKEIISECETIKIDRKKLDEKFSHENYARLIELKLCA